MNPVFKFAIREDLQDMSSTFLPKRAEPFATGWDVCAAFPDRKAVILQPGQYVKIPLGFRAFCPDGWWFQLNPRSSTFTKKNMHALIGVIDEHFPLEVLFAAQYLPSDNFNLVINFGDPIAQIIPIKRNEMTVENISNEEIDDLYSKRKSIRTGGFGSTSK